jgi:nucleoside 2-deoxyribosyltransferase
MKVYVASSLELKNHNLINYVCNRFKAAGVSITHEWLSHGLVTDQATLKDCCEKEINGVKDSDIVFMLFPARNGTHVELGIAIAQDKPVVLVTDPKICQVGEEKPFYYADNITRVYDLEEGIKTCITMLQDQYAILKECLSQNQQSYDPT